MTRHTGRAAEGPARPTEVARGAADEARRERQQRSWGTADRLGGAGGEVADTQWHDKTKYEGRSGAAESRRSGAPARPRQRQTAWLAKANSRTFEREGVCEILRGVGWGRRTEERRDGGSILV